MQEKSYKTVSRIGGYNIAVGVVALISGLVCGVLMIVNGARLLKAKSDILF